MIKLLRRPWLAAGVAALTVLSACAGNTPRESTHYPYVLSPDQLFVIEPAALFFSEAYNYENENLKAGISLVRAGGYLRLELEVTNRSSVPLVLDRKLVELYGIDSLKSRQLLPPILPETLIKQLKDQIEAKRNAEIAGTVAAVLLVGILVAAAVASDADFESSDNSSNSSSYSSGGSSQNSSGDDPETAALKGKIKEIKDKYFDLDTIAPGATTKKMLLTPFVPVLTNTVELQVNFPGQSGFFVRFVPSQIPL